MSNLGVPFQGALRNPHGAWSPLGARGLGFGWLAITMLLLGACPTRLALAAAPECDVDAAVVAVRDEGAPAAYLCLAGADAGDDVLRTAIVENEGNTPRLSRALALWLLSHADIAFPAEDVAVLAPADERLLADGIKARRGRRSPVPEHAAVFEQFAWYAPSATYTDAALRSVDQANLRAMVGAPSAVPAQATAVSPAQNQAALAGFLVPTLVVAVFLVGGAFAFSRARRE